MKFKMNFIISYAWGPQAPGVANISGHMNFILKFICSLCQGPLAPGLGLKEFIATFFGLGPEAPGIENNDIHAAFHAAFNVTLFARGLRPQAQIVILYCKGLCPLA